MTPLLMALLGACLTWLLTAAGSASVLFFRKEIPRKLQCGFLGFAAGVMIAASIWSLLMPSLERAETLGYPYIWLPVASGVACGVLFLLVMDRAIAKRRAGSHAKRHLHCTDQTLLLFLAVTLHNIPEGLAIGLAFGLCADGGSSLAVSAAIALTVGIGIQNFPEGAAVSLPFRRDGMGRLRSFWLGALSAIVEPIAAVLGALLATQVAPLMPWLLAFAAGAMFYVVVEELIPEAHIEECAYIGTLSVMAGFLAMMILDVALG